jgi:ribonuclease HI
MKVEAYTDGACKGNPGPGGWGVLLKYGNIEKELFGGAAHTTNNQRELIAVIEALKALNLSKTLSFGRRLSGRYHVIKLTGNG